METHSTPGTCSAHKNFNQRLCFTRQRAGVDSQRHSSFFPSPTRKIDTLLRCRETSGRQPRGKASYRRPSRRFLPCDLHHGLPSPSCPQSSNSIHPHQWGGLVAVPWPHHKFSWLHMPAPLPPPPLHPLLCPESTTWLKAWQHLWPQPPTFGLRFFIHEVE